MIAKMRLAASPVSAPTGSWSRSGIADAFAAAMAERMAAVRVGRPGPGGHRLGPWPTTVRWTRSADLVEDAVARGAVVIVEADIPDGPGYFFAPTVLDHVPADAAIMHEEVFGPSPPSTGSPPRPRP